LELRVGSVLQTADDGHIDLELLPNTLARLMRNSELLLYSLLLSKDGNETADAMLDRRAECVLKKGTLLVHHRRPGIPTAKLRIRTDLGTVRADSNCLVLINASSERTRVTCFRGAADLDPVDDRPQFTVTAGSVGELGRQTSSVMAIAADAAAQSEVGVAIVAQRDLLDLAEHQQDLLPGPR
jgi:hypothetical protein